MQFSFDSTLQYTEDYIIDYLKSCTPEEEIFKCTDNHGNTLLHTYAGRKYEKLQDYILSEYPDIVYAENDMFESPLMSAIDFRNASLVKKILDIDPGLLYLGDENGDCAFQREVHFSYGSDEILREMWPYYDEEKVNYERLLIGVMSNSAIKTKFILENSPNGYNYIDPSGNNVLHMACKVYSHHNFVLKDILENSEGLAEHANDEGKIPLHYAAFSNKKFTQVYNVFPAGIYVQDEAGNTPLHIFVQDQYDTTEILMDVIRSHPDLLSVQNNKGDTIAMAMSRNYSVPFMSYMCLMFYTNPVNFTIKNKDNKNVLHEICYYKGYNWYKIVDVIMEKYPYLIFEKDNDGFTPLDYGTLGVGEKSYKVDQENFLTVCLKYTPLEDKYWKVFYGTCPRIAIVFGDILKRSEEEASKAFKLLSHSTKERVHAILTSLSKYNLEKEHINDIVSYALKK
ncbi:Ankyrin repeat-containing protein [Only Syngen Nebraska virus 5]|uniref:Ankyrin repeat-containing protein n=1 Tax=Only Syngen Nebraska virus 5 TaxID=1917232 RepID=UPI0009012085|nr:Ankyrin repeat-containing protein [Only Syngen Nebraska virus 5]APC25730.1 Ankyrin repeat-containing protein [Only Syngen Nebraska virus 5]